MIELSKLLQEYYVFYNYECFVNAYDRNVLILPDAEI